MPTGGKGNDTMENIATINISHEANITGKGTHRRGNVHSVIATEIFEARTSQLDMGNHLGVSFQTISSVINGRTQTAGIYKRDENGNLRRVGYTKVYRANDPRAIEALLENGKKLMKENAELKEKAAAWDANKGNLEHANRTIDSLTTSLANANDELAAFRAYKAQKEKVKELDATINELKAKLLEAVEAHNAAVAELVELEKAL